MAGWNSVRGRVVFASKAGVVIGISIAASGINFIAQAVLAYRFGAGHDVDAYMFALSVPTFAAGLIAAIVSYTVIPAIAGEERADARAALAGTISRITTMGAGILLVAGLPALFLQPLLLPKASSIVAHTGLPSLLLLAWAFAAVQIIAATWGARLNATGSPVVASTMALWPGVGGIGFLLVFTDWGVKAAVCGTIFGSIAAIAYARRVGGGGRAQPLRYDAQMKVRISQLAYRSLAAVVAVSCFSSYAISDAFWGPRVGEGTLAALGYAERVVIGVGALAVTGPSALCVPMFARMVTANDLPGFRRLFLQTISWVALIGGGIAFMLALNADSIVRLMFERGAFGVKQVELVAGTIRYMAMGMFFMLISVIEMRALFCIRRSGYSTALLGAGWTASYFLLSGLLADRGATGIASAYSVSWAVFAIIAFTVVMTKSRSSDGYDNTMRKPDISVGPC